MRIWAQVATDECMILFESGVTMKSILLASLLLSSAAMAETSSLSLKQQAMAENKIDGQAQKTASDAQVAPGMLSLKDPRPEVMTRTWVYFAGFTAENFQPRGTVATDEVGNFNLGNNGSTFMPGLTVGFLTPEMTTGPLAWKVGVRGNGAFSSQGVSLTYPNGYHVSDARLNTMLLGVGPTMSLSWTRYNWLAFTFTPQYGSVNYTQTSSNDFARFSKQSSYLGLNFGLDFQVAKKWSVFTEYQNRNMRDSNQDIALQKDNFELGTKVTW